MPENVLLPAVQSPVARAALDIINSNTYEYDASGYRGRGWLTDDKMDCSEFVLQSFRKGGFPGFNASNSREMALRFKVLEADEVQAGDIVYWSRGHVGIVLDPSLGTFAGAQSSGLAIANYKHGYWAAHGLKKFLRYGE